MKTNYWRWAFVCGFVLLLGFEGITLATSQENEKVSEIKRSTDKRDSDYRRAVKTYPDRITKKSKLILVSVDKVEGKPSFIKVGYAVNMDMAGAGIDGSGNPIPVGRTWSVRVTRDVEIPLAERKNWGKYASADFKKFLNPPAPTVSAPETADIQ